MAKEVFDNYNQHSKRHRCCNRKCKRVRAESQMYYTGKQSKNKRDGQWHCINCKTRKIKKVEPEKPKKKGMFGKQLVITPPTQLNAIN